MGLAPSPPRAPRAPGRARRLGGRIDGWTVLTVVAALLVAGPLLTLPSSFLGEPRALEDFGGLLPEALSSTAILVLGVGLGTLVLGTALAALVSFYEFPGRRVLDWALVLPLAMPAYVLTLVLLGSLGSDLPLRTPGGTVAVLTLVLYPYVYLLARGAFLGQSRAQLDAARALGLSRRGAILRVALPMARPALAGGVALALMEALADFGAVNLLGLPTFTDAIYRVWFGAFDRDAALQLATLLGSITLTLLALERLARGRARYADQAARGDEVGRARLRGPAAAAAVGLPALLVGLVVVLPVGQLAAWALEAVSDDRLGPGFGQAARNSVLLAGMSVVLVVGLAILMAYGARVSPSRSGAAAARTATIGYGLPGSVVAAAVIGPLAWGDRRLDGGLGLLGVDPGLVFTGTAVGLFFAYLVRFLALAYNSVAASLERVPPSLDEAARGLGADRLDVLARVHLPLARTGLLTAALLVFAEVMKELPATLLLRPFGGDTLAISVWQATKESLWETAALPALLIVLIGLVPIALLIRLSDRPRGARA